MSAGYVYILQCVDGTLYTGVTKDVAVRLAAHNAGRGAKYTRGWRPVRLAYVEVVSDRSRALAREQAIKRLPAARKRALIVSCGMV